MILVLHVIQKKILPSLLEIPKHTMRVTATAPTASPQISSATFLSLDRQESCNKVKH
jgi:hypothetical protein